MIPVVLDTNIIVSAFLNPRGKPSDLLKLVLCNKLQICCDTAIIAEYEEVLSRSKFANRFDKAQIQRFFDIIMKIGLMVSAQPSGIPFVDESDRVFYDKAKASNATLVTGNLKHFPADDFIMSPSDFLLSISTP